MDSELLSSTGWAMEMLLRLLKLAAVTYLIALLAVTTMQAERTDNFDARTASETNKQRIVELDARVDNLEAWKTEVTNLHIEASLASIKSTVDNDHDLLKGIGLAVIIMAGESIIRIVKSLGDSFKKPRSQ